MKIGFISTYFYPFEGGAERVCLETAKELAKRHEVHVFTSDRKKVKTLEKKDETVFGINIHRCREIFRLGYYLAFYPAMLFKVLRHDLDIVHVHSIGFLQHDLAILLKKIFSPKTKFICTPHGPVMALKNNPTKTILKNIITLFENLINKIYSATTVITPAQKKWISEYGLKNPILIPNGLPKEFFKEINTKGFIKKYGLENKTILSYIGRIQKYKGIQHVLECLPRVLEKFPNTIFLIGGIDENFASNLKDIVNAKNLQRSVVFLGELSEDEKIAALEASDIYILPSEWEAFGISMLEAMARGNAIISTKTEGGLFLVRQNENGLLCNFGDTEEFEKSIIVLIENKKLRQEMQNNNRKVAKKFVWDKIAADLEKLYLEVLNENRKN